MLFTLCVWEPRKCEKKPVTLDLILMGLFRNLGCLGYNVICFDEGSLNLSLALVLESNLV